ncbi:MAG: ribonuclease P protein subunit [Candidatus Bilamarchaeaceae archaeon]
MPITKKNILHSTFIGLKVEIVKSSQKHLVGLKGTVVDETKNMLVIESEKKERKIQKNSCVFRFFVDDGYVDVDGEKITFRHFERPKKVKKNAIVSNRKSFNSNLE